MYHYIRYQKFGMSENQRVLDAQGPEGLDVVNFQLELAAWCGTIVSILSIMF